MFSDSIITIDNKKDFRIPSFQCLECTKVTPMVAADCSKCPSCDCSNGKLLNDDQLDEGLDKGYIWPIDSKTGNRKKK